MTDEKSDDDASKQCKHGVYTIKIGDQNRNFKKYHSEDPIVTGHQLLNFAELKPVDEYLIFMLLKGGEFEEIRLNETVDLRRKGIEKFIYFESSSSYRFVIDGERIEWGTNLISGLKLKQIAKVDPKTYAIWQEIRGGEDLPLNNEDIIDLSEKGVERFFTVIEQTTAGDDNSFLPSRDKIYLNEHNIPFEEVVDGPKRGVVLKTYNAPLDNYNENNVDALIILPPGYPDIPPDMFYLFPWLRDTKRNTYPHCADQPLQFAGRNWQRWSRHNKSWRPGIDGIWTMLKRVDRAIMEAA